MKSDIIIGAKLYDDPLQLYNVLLEDIKAAKNSILIETYRFANDPIGIKFRDALIKSAKRGVKINMLLDSWGTSVPASFFDGITLNGGQIRYFKKLKLFFDFFTKNHRRNHRKLLLIDDEITYIGSANISGYSLNWRESVLRIKGKITLKFKDVFFDNYELYKKYNFKKFAQKKLIKFHHYEIIRDIPSIYRQKIKRKYEKLIREAKEQLIIETPYFIPGFKLRKGLADAAARGVDVKVILPKNSDVRLIDILRNKYTGELYENGVKFKFYSPSNLHAKLMLIDDRIFSIGSANFDYRSFRYQYEIVLVGREDNIVKNIKKHISETLDECEDFDYQKWLRRTVIQKVFEFCLLPFRHLL